MDDSRVGRANARIGDILDVSGRSRVFQWTHAHLRYSLQYFNKPLSKEILPQPQHKPYTLCLSLDDLLITSTWDVRRASSFFTSHPILTFVTS